MNEETLDKSVKQDIELRRELDKVNWGKYLSWGTVKIQVRVQVRDGKKVLVGIERTYPDDLDN